ncbi:MAG: hypothetical protein J5944_01335 [Lentisphaeria bacterium]|nr:hypothetical protein [Lentisphaeria bacterium]
MNWISLSSESPGVIRDENGVPVEWTLLRVGENPICQEGKDGALVLSAAKKKNSEILPIIRKTLLP